MSKPGKRRYSPEEKRKYADKLRKRMTPSEKVMWRHLKKMKECRWEAQQVICGYIPDFVERDLKLILEVDGPYHNRQKNRDIVRTRNLEHSGYKVLRVLNREVQQKLDTLLECLLMEVYQRQRH